MSKQEEIRIELVTMIHTSCNEDVEVLVTRILDYQDRKGVVLKVDRELPELKVAWEDGVSYTAPYEYAQKEMLDSGWEATESLVEKYDAGYNPDSKDVTFREE